MKSPICLPPLSLNLITLVCLTAMTLSGADKKDSDWTELTAGQGLKAWRIAVPNGNGTADWITCSKAELSSENPLILRTQTGKTDAVIVNGPAGKAKNIVSVKEHGDAEIHIEFLVAEKSNSGIYFMGRYEIQVLDNWGKEHVGDHDSGAIYQRWDPNRGKGKEGYEGHAPRVNASRKAGEWQTFDVIFRAPRFNKDGEKTSNAEFVKVVHNGTVIHENVQLTGPTRGKTFFDESASGPILLQGDHGPVAYRNIRFRILR